MSPEKNRRPVTARELLAKLHSDPEWVAMMEQKERKRLAWAQVLLDDGADVDQELREAGFDIEYLEELYNRKEPWRKDEPLPRYPEAIPILAKHLERPHLFEVKGSIVRALTCPEGREALDVVVAEFRRTSDPKVAEEEKRRTVEKVLENASEYYTREELEYYVGNRWQTYRFELANAIAYLMTKKQLGRVMDLLGDETLLPEDRKLLAEMVQRRVKRWRRVDPEVHAVLNDVLKSGSA